MCHNPFKLFLGGHHLYMNFCLSVWVSQFSEKSFVFYSCVRSSPLIPISLLCFFLFGKCFIQIFKLTIFTNIKDVFGFDINFIFNIISFLHAYSMQTYWQLNSWFFLQSFTSFHMSIPIIHASTFKIGLWPATTIT